MKRKDYIQNINSKQLIMKEEILSNLNNPIVLEKLYRDDKTEFEKTFNLLFPDIREHANALFWNARLNFRSSETIIFGGIHFYFVLGLCLLAGLFAKLPDFSSLTPEFFYPRNIAFIIFPFITAYFLRIGKAGIKQIIITSSLFLLSCLYINTLPGEIGKSDTLQLACIHLPVLLWAITGFAFTGIEFNSLPKRIDFLKYNGDLLVMMALILISGALLSGITFGLFEVINLNIESFYMKYVGVIGLAATPVFATYLVRTNPHIVSKVSPLIAKVFSPLVLVMLIVYLAAVFYTGKDPYNNRDFLLLFNVLLIGVMTLVLFSVVETTKGNSAKISSVILLALSLTTIVVNGIALSAILFRISEWGLTPNRMAVLGGNILILVHLILVTFSLSKSGKDQNQLFIVEKNITSYLPVYIIWAIIVTFIFPFVFGFK